MTETPQVIEPRTLLTCIPLFSGLRPERLSRLGAACRIDDVPAQTNLYRAGDHIGTVRFLISGAVKRYIPLEHGAEKVLSILQPGQLFPMGELFSGPRHASSADTIAPSVIAGFASEALLDIARHDAGFALRLTENIARQHYRSEFEVASHHSQSVTRRVLDYLLRLAGDERGIAGETTVQLDASKKLIAARLDMAPETFSRTLRQLSEEGVIVVDGRTIHIQNATLVAGTDTESGPPRALYSRLQKGAAATAPGAGTLINQCGRHRMLSQRMATAWVLIARRISAESAGVSLRRFRDQFQRNLAGLAAMALPAELAEPLEALQMAWMDFQHCLSQTSQGKTQAERVFDRSEHILAAADRLTGNATRWAGSEEAEWVNIAGRNRMLSARMTKLFLFFDWGILPTEVSRLMAASRAEFDDNITRLETLSHGSPEVSAQLAIERKQWRDFLNVVDHPDDRRSGARTTHARVLLAASEPLIRQADTTVKVFERLAEQGSPQAA